MKKIYLMLTMLSLTSTVYGSSADYSCLPIEDDFYTFEGSINLQVVGDGTFLVNGKDSVTIDKSYKPRNSYNKTLKRLAGEFTTLKEQCPGDNIYLLVNKYILSGSKFGYMKYVCSGNGGSATIMFKCNLKERLNE